MRTAVNSTVPLPVPDELVAIHETAGCAVHEQPAPAVTLKLTFRPPPAGSEMAGGLIEKLQPVCVTVTTCVPIVIVALRGAPPFGAALKVTDPVDVPVAPDVIVSHGAELDAAHAHAAGSVTTIVPVPPPPAMLNDAGETVTKQLVVAVRMSCAIVDVKLLAVDSIQSVRVVFAATRG